MYVYVSNKVRNSTEYVAFFFCTIYRCDCYILKDILQNWSDEDAAQILSNLRAVMDTDHRLLVIETIMHTGSYAEERVSSNETFRLCLYLMAISGKHVHACVSADVICT